MAIRIDKKSGSKVSDDSEIGPLIYGPDWEDIKSKGYEGALEGYAHIRNTKQRQQLAENSLKPEWAAGKMDKGEGPGLILMFNGLYIPFRGILTQRKLMEAAEISLWEVGGSDHRFIEFVKRQKKPFKGYPVWAIITGS